MLAAERRNLILEKLQEEKRVIVSDLSQRFQVSEETIRRDLDKLDRDGLATKSYGGAILNENTNLEIPFNIRKKSNVSGKGRIAKLVDEIVEDGEHIILDASTTSVFIAKALTNKQRLTVITNSIEVLAQLSDVPGWDIICTGGTLKENYLALVGERAIKNLSSFHAEKSIISCKGLDLEKGITDPYEMFSSVKQAMLKNAQKKIVAVDHTKFGKISFSHICDFSEIDMIITDEKPEESWLKFFENNKIECLYPE